MKKKVVVIGAGPAGIMAAISAAEHNKEVVLIDKNDHIGRKLRITGGGRCNITNNCSINEIIEKTLSNGKFLYNSLNKFSNINLINFIESNGCKLKVEHKGKVFPVSDKSDDIINVFSKVLNNNEVILKMNCEVKEVLVSDNKVSGVRLQDNNIIRCDGVVISTGGMSYPHLGSTGDGYRFASDLEHNIVKIRPSLVPINIKEKWIKDLMGISLNSVKITTKISNKKKISSKGDLLFTHYGISGPAVLEHSAYLSQYSEILESTIHLDLLPNYNQEELEQIFHQESQFNGSKLVKTVLTDLLPKNLCSKLLDLLNIDEYIKLGQLSKKDRNKIINTIKSLTLTTNGFRHIKEAIVTSGGISVKEIDSKTMESKLMKGLYFAGEVIDIDALTGGYNLQIAFSTGYVAGINV
ncbi:NAD(P)/FAD-dependent oxidoreductase [Alkaliphilus sp. MSJ-5]|uniref:NAD(P)/FAD-dependent oxidoreductase n=1 Tax=Alkaliphilus flagellatus TaxID=2841507 RepID=A0ABS6G4W8_9FIRM|nr:NAD(P)/FAD-dependent oxidoreductase [Alkaliphilus flagellatus]MBU5677512.1 NAD(P)/FAD-dependent oxidoreductase [Alkaliphilus flagellatus]